MLKQMGEDASFFSDIQGLASSLIISVAEIVVAEDFAPMFFLCVVYSKVYIFTVLDLLVYCFHLLY